MTDNGMFKNARIISLFTIISRILGYLRDLMIARYFGAGIYSDMFFIAFRMPNSLRRFIGEGAVNSSVVPVISRLNADDRAKAVWNLLFVFAVLLFGISIAGVIFSRELITVFAPGYLHSDKFFLMNNMVKIIFPYIFFIGLVVLLTGILNMYGRYALPASAPALLNVSIIGSIALLFHMFHYPVYALCVGVIVGGILQLALCFAGFLSLRLPVVLKPGLEKSTLEVLRLLGITALGSSVFQIASMVDAFMASFMPHGSFSYLFYANRLFQLPFAVFVIALTQSSIVDLSKREEDEVLPALKGALKLTTLVSITVTLYFLFFGRDVIGVLFEHGKFSSLSADNTYLALALLMPGFFFFAQSKLLSNLFYARKDAKTPMKASVFGAIATVVFSVIFGLLAGFSGLALAVTLSGIVNMISLVVFVNRRMEGLTLEDFFDLDAVALSVLLVGATIALKHSVFGGFLNLILATLMYAMFIFVFYKKLHLE